MVSSKGFKLFGTLIHPRTNGFFLLLDTKKTFNEFNRIGMLWKVCHLWQSGARFFLLLLLVIARLAKW